MPLLRSAFIALSRNRALRALSERSAAGNRLSSRFVAGTTTQQALEVCRSVNAQGMHVTLDSLGESVSSADAAERAAAVYHELLDAIHAHQLDANISVKLTHMGLALDPALAERIAEGLAEHAAGTGNFLRIDMEDSSLTAATLGIVQRLHARPALRGAIGIVIQAYLYRSAEDVAALLADRIRIRLCKGAYQEPANLAFPKKSDVDANYVRLTETLLLSPVYHGLATHDEAMIAAAKQFAAQHGITKERFEFQMLYGVRRDLQRKLVAEGYNVRVYVPFGREWYPYFMRRLAERPANLIFLAKNLLR